MEWLDEIVSFSANYPIAADFVTYISYLVGFWLIVWTLKLFYDARVLRSLPIEKMSNFRTIGLLAIASALISFASTISSIGNSLFDYDVGYTASEFMSYADLEIQNNESSLKVLQNFSLVSLNILGRIFALWGLYGMYSSLSPNAANSQEDGGLKAGFLRVIVGVIFIKPKEFFNLFGNHGDTIFGV